MIHGDTANIDELENLTAPIKEQATDMLHDQGLSIDDYVLFLYILGNINIFCRTSLRKRLVKIGCTITVKIWRLSIVFKYAFIN